MTTLHSPRFSYATVYSFILLATFTLLSAVPEKAYARITLPVYSVIGMSHSPHAGMNTYPGDRTAAYKKSIADMRALGVDAFAQDYFNVPRDVENTKSLAAAVRAWNQEHNDDFCWFLLADSVDSNTGPIVDDMKKYANGPDYCQIQGKPVLSVWNGGRAGAVSGSTFVSSVLNPLKAAGLEPYFIYERAGDVNKVKENVQAMRNAGFSVGFYDFGASGAERDIQSVKTLQSALGLLGVSVYPGVSPAYWQTCGESRSNYMEHNGFEGWYDYWRAMVPGGTLNRPDYVWLTMWDDRGEDNFLEGNVVSCGSPYAGAYCSQGWFGNKAMPVWTKRGFAEFAKRYIQWYKTGTEPAVTKDTVYFTYRQHPKDLAAPSGDQCVAAGKTITNTNDAEDVVYVTTELTAPATLTVSLGGTTIGTFNAQSGTNNFKAPWGSKRGKPTFTLTRNGNTVVSGSGQLEITNTPKAFGGAGTRNFSHYGDFLQGAGGGGSGGGDTGGGSGGGTGGNGVPTSCQVSYGSGSTAPNGYGVSYNVFTTARELLVTASCPTSTTIQATVGSGASSQYIYTTGYSWTGAAWQPYTLTGGTAASDIWLTGSGTASFPRQTGTTYFVGYVCQQQGGIWKCGCRDTTCSTAYWQLQAL